MKMLKNATRSFLGNLCSQSPFAGALGGVMCSLLLLSTGVPSAQAQERRDTTQPVSKISDKDRAREFELITAQPPNSIQVQVRYKKEYGYKDDTNAFGDVGPISCGAFSISALPDPSVRLEYLIGIHNPGKMRESDGFYVCDFLVADLPLNAPIKVGVDLVDHRSSPFEAWKGDSQAQPPPGQQRTIIIVSGRASRERRGKDGREFRGKDGTVTLTQAQPRATQVFEMVYAAQPLIPPNQRVPQTKPPVPPR
jgi:hypothetical protein